jgi:AraC family transcriptional regulator, regulatory protein of adaptative response / methylated-DNA-[protein]-cysteine methyltransferase
MTKPSLAAPASAAPGADPRWTAVETRDRRYDGVFFFAVRSTGVYCRPSCPARRPDPRRVDFFAAPEAAEEAGFRACLRCRPREAGHGDPAVALTRRGCALLHEETEEKPALAGLARRLGVAPERLQRAFRRVLGITPREYAETRRWGALKAGLRGGRSVTHALYDAGYGSASRVYESAGARLGMTPAQYGRGGRGMAIGYRVVASPLGRLLVAATPRGVCMVSLGDSDRALLAALRDEYPAAELRAGGAEMTRWIVPLVRSLRAGESAPDLPLDVRATAFQGRVWRALREIPRGQTRTYAEIARAIGRPGAARAVGRACGSNPVSLVIPCHRAVGADGSLTGYRWGVERKRRLLAAEAKGAPARRPAGRRAR